jgi:hypothetical protein
VNNKMGGYRLEGHITGPRIRRLEETCRRQRRKEVSSDGGQGPEGAVAH